MTEEIDLFHFPNVGDREKITIISQPGIRFAQAEVLIESLLQDEKFESLSALDRSRIETRILDTIRERMMEDIVLLETKISKPDRKVFKLQFALGEFDMVVYDRKNLTCEIYEIKHSKEAVKEQYQFLSNPEYCAMTEYRFGNIIGKYVIYRGENREVNGISYLNVEEYLKKL